MRVIIAGSREIADYSLVLSAIEIANFNITAVVSGCARGVDRLGERFAGDCNLDILRYPADWDKFKRSAGFIRNEEMAKNSDALIAIWDGVSPGTKNMIANAKKYGLKIYIHYVDIIND